jgi:separase
MASCELLLPPTQVSLKPRVNSISVGAGDNPEEDRRCVVGAILERQVDSLAGSLWKPDVQSAVKELLTDCALTYDSEERPIRHAGVLLRDLELLYYTGAADEAGQLTLEKSTEKIKTLLDLGVHLFPAVVTIPFLLTWLQNVGRDSALTHLLVLHRAEMHMWLALHAHRQVHPQQCTLIAQHAREACRVLGLWVHGTPERTAEAKGSPKQVRASRRAKGKTASVRAVAAATRKPKASKAVPTTPKRPRSEYETLNSLRCFRLTRLSGSQSSRVAESPAVLKVGRWYRTHSENFSSDRVTSEYAHVVWGSVLVDVHLV